MNRVFLRALFAFYPVFVALPYRFILALLGDELRVPAAQGRRPVRVPVAQGHGPTAAAETGPARLFAARLRPKP